MASSRQLDVDGALTPAVSRGACRTDHQPHLPGGCAVVLLAALSVKTVPAKRAPTA
ncbi:hypothetical protein XAP6164_2600008 [Xanthomonas phaseoli pv. phaseoli]|nr:hypothetical protein XAP6164_2600008 [Xanthomonas phaseoli pv. phaseoli]